MIYLQISTPKGLPNAASLPVSYWAGCLLRQRQKMLRRKSSPKLRISTALCRRCLNWTAIMPKLWHSVGKVRSNGYAPAPSARNIRVKTGISAFSACPICLKCRLKAKLSSKPAVRAVKAGSTSIKLKVLSVPLIKQAVFPCASKANAVSMPTKNWL